MFTIRRASLIACMCTLSLLLTTLGCASEPSAHFTSRDKHALPQRIQDLQTLIDQTPDDTALRLPAGTYIINKGLLVKSRTGLSIIGEKGTAILLTNLDQDVLAIEDSRNIRIFNLLLRHHTPLKTYECHGSVVRIDKSKDITLANNELNGCGAVGVSAQQSAGLTIEHCYIHSNSFNALYLSDLQGVRLWSNVITHNANTLQLYNVTEVQMSDNVISDNSGYWRTPTHPPGLLEWSTNVSENTIVNDK